MSREPDIGQMGMQRYYAERAPEYDAVYSKPERQADLRQIERWLPGVFQGTNLLEIACGTGYWTQFLGPGCDSVVGVDTAPQTLGVARTRVPLDRVHFVLADAYVLPFRRRQFRAAFAGFWWSHIPRARIRGFLLGLHAVLQPGARVVFLDNRFVARSSTALSERDEDGNTYQVRRLADGSVHRVMKNFPTRTDLTEATSGLVDGLKYHEWQHYWALEYRVAT